MELMLMGRYRLLIIKIFGELDQHKASSVRENADRELGRTGAVNVAFNFENVTFMDSSGIGVIMGRYKTVTALGGKVIIYGASDAVNRLIEMSGIKSIVTVADNLENGVKEAGIDNIMEIKFPNKSDNERFARTVAAAFVLELDPTVDQISEIKTAVSEAVTNAIIHGYDEKDGIVTMSGSIEDDTVTFSVSDDGVGIPDISRAREPLFTGKPEMERSGMGFTIMETFMDSIEVQSEVGKGTRITMTKKLK